jgi:hypothetical protein
VPGKTWVTVPDSSIGSSFATQYFSCFRNRADNAPFFGVKSRENPRLWPKPYTKAAAIQTTPARPAAVATKERPVGFLCPDPDGVMFAQAMEGLQ